MAENTQSRAISGQRCLLETPFPAYQWRTIQRQSVFGVVPPARSTPTPPFSTQPSQFLLLPREIRMQILQLCVSLARNCPVCQDEHGQPLIHNINVQSRGGMRMSGIGPLPILFVRKLIHRELVSIIYSLISNVAVTGIFLEEQNQENGRLYAKMLHPHVRFVCILSEQDISPLGSH